MDARVTQVEQNESHRVEPIGDRDLTTSVTQIAKAASHGHIADVALAPHGAALRLWLLLHKSLPSNVLACYRRQRMLSAEPMRAP